MENMLEMTS
jgi:hypothetical protein